MKLQKKTKFNESSSKLRGDAAVMAHMWEDFIMEEYLHSR